MQPSHTQTLTHTHSLQFFVSVQWDELWICASWQIWQSSGRFSPRQRGLPSSPEPEWVLRVESPPSEGQEDTGGNGRPRCATVILTTFWKTFGINKWKYKNQHNLSMIEFQYNFLMLRNSRHTFYGVIKIKQTNKQTFFYLLEAVLVCSESELIKLFFTKVRQINFHLVLIQIKWYVLFVFFQMLP